MKNRKENRQVVEERAQFVEICTTMIQQEEKHKKLNIHQWTPKKSLQSQIRRGTNIPKCTAGKQR